MAADWIKWLKGLSEKREVRAVAHKLGMDRRVIACACMEFWEWADDETCDGHIRGVTTADIDDLVSIPGFADALADKEVRWLHVTERGLSIPNFERHNGKSAKRRALDSIRKISEKIPLQKRKKSGLEKRREEKRRTDTPKPSAVADSPKALTAQQRMVRALADVFFGGTIPERKASMLGARAAQIIELGGKPEEVPERYTAFLDACGGKRGVATIHKFADEWCVHKVQDNSLAWVPATEAEADAIYREMGVA